MVRLMFDPSPMHPGIVCNPLLMSSNLQSAPSPKGHLNPAVRTAWRAIDLGLFLYYPSQQPLLRGARHGGHIIIRVRLVLVIQFKAPEAKNGGPADVGPAKYIAERDEGG